MRENKYPAVTEKPKRRLRMKKLFLLAMLLCAAAAAILFAEDDGELPGSGHDDEVRAVAAEALAKAQEALEAANAAALSAGEAIAAQAEAEPPPVRDEETRDDKARAVAAEALAKAQEALEAANAAALSAEEAAVQAATQSGGKSWAKGFSISVDIDGNLWSRLKTDVKNDQYIAQTDYVDEEQDFWMNAGSFGDTEIKFSYDDPEERFGGLIVFDFPGTLGGAPPLGDVYGWSKITQYARIRIGKFEYSIIDKVGGDKDTGVFELSIDKANNDLVITTSESLEQQAKVIGFLGSALVGPVEAGFFAAPNAFFPARYYTTQQSTNVTTTYPPQKISAYETYNMGGNLKVTLPDWFALGLSYRQKHTESTGGLSRGDIFHDFSIYARVMALGRWGIDAGLGYSGRIDYSDIMGDVDAEKDPDDPNKPVVITDKEPWLKAPLKSAFHFDVKYVPTFLPDLTFASYNNISFYTREKQDTFAYDQALDQVASLYANEESFVLYNEIFVSYALSMLRNLTGGLVTPSLMFRNYVANLSGVDGIKSQNYGKHILILEGKVAYKISDNVEVRAGIKWEKTEYKTPPVSDVLRNSTDLFAVPVGVTVKW
jgi:multidrug efflux pump subunit AcrA (membrane-fusion protein)